MKDSDNSMKRRTPDWRRYLRVTQPTKDLYPDYIKNFPNLTVEILSGGKGPGEKCLLWPSSPRRLRAGLTCRVAPSRPRKAGTGPGFVTLCLMSGPGPSTE